MDHSHGHTGKPTCRLPGDPLPDPAGCLSCDLTSCAADDRNPLLHPMDLSPRKPLLQVDTDQHCGPEPALMAILEASGRTWGGGFCPQLSRPRWLVSRRDTPHHTGVCVLGAPGLPGPAGRPCPAVTLGPTDAAVATASRPEPSFPALCAASLPRASVPGEARPRPGEKDLAQGTWDPSGEEALRLGSVIGRVGYLCACACVTDRRTHTHRGSLLEISLKGCGRGNTVELGKKLPRRWAS